jgi:hypothetical protein
MRDVIRQFRERQLEIENYFTLLENIMLQDAKFLFPDGTQMDVDIDLRHILRANAFLLLYNLVESSISQAIEAIHLDIASKQNLDFDKLTQNLKKEIIGFIKKDVSIETFIGNSGKISEYILQHYPTNREIFSGNVDAKEIKKIGIKYGFSYETNAQLTKNGEKLLTVKSQRNNLAHGFISFKDCGRDYPIEDILEMKLQIFAYLEQILNNIGQFVDNQKYRHS